MSALHLAPGREARNAPLTTRIRGQLHGSGWGSSQLQIEDDGQAVTLRGVASSFYQRQVWLHRTKQVIGEGRRINDEICVTECPDAFASFD
jgi:hypothetical protein